MIPTDIPGLTRRPFGSIVSPDDLDFNEVFFDDVEVPADNLIGGLNDGWRVATGSLGHERAMLWLGMAERLDGLIEHGGETLVARGLADDPLVLDWFGNLVVDDYALRLLGYRTLAKARRGVEATEQSILKLLGSEAVQSATLAMLETGRRRPRPGPPQRPARSAAPRGVHGELVGPLPAELRRHHRRRHIPDPAQHHRGAGAGSAALSHAWHSAHRSPPWPWRRPPGSAVRCTCRR